MTDTESTTTTKAETGGEGGGAEAPAGADYSRGENQKPVTDRYRSNWDAIFGRKTRRR